MPRLEAGEALRGQITVSTTEGQNFNLVHTGQVFAGQ